MDFSSVPRALESLQRRQPPLEDAILDVSQQLLELWKNTTPATQQSSATLRQGLTTLLADNKSNRWEPLAVGLYLATEILQERIDAAASATNKPVYMEGPRVPSIKNDENSATTTTAATTDAATTTTSRWNDMMSREDVWYLCHDLLHPLCLKHLEHKEPRVRTLVAKAVGAYSKVTCLEFASSKEAKSMRQQVHETVVSSIRTHIATGRQEAEEAAAAKSKQDDSEEKDRGQDTSNNNNNPKTENYSRSSTGALDDTTGWRALETNWHCLASLMSALGPDYLTEFGIAAENNGRVFDPQLLKDCQYCCQEHLNRHVRAAGLAVLEQCVHMVAAAPADQRRLLLTQRGAPLRVTVAACLKDGLADNWSQVRMAASVLCRVFFTTLQDNLQEGEDDDWTADLFPSLLPRMCLNRFYLAQGVKLYSHETWRMVLKDQGVAMVVKYLPAVCRYYVKMCDADNHVVREAACQAIAELAVRLSSSGEANETKPEQHEYYYTQLQQQVDVLLQALLMCFFDESWPVRDEACLACGLLCRSYPEECRPELKTLWERWTEQLTDQIWSVREDAAVALGDALDAYGEEMFSKVRALIDELLPSAKNQPAMTMADYKARQNDAAAHTDSQLYSCGSLAPKLRKSGAGRIGGCSSCDVTREKSPWEATDGCLYLIREVVSRCSTENNSNDDTPPLLSEEELVSLLTQVVDVCRVQHFPQADDLRATLWRQLPVMAQALGKQRFKRHYLEIFMDLLFSNLEARTASQLSKHAAGQCAEELAQLVGPAIFRGRLDDYQRETFDQVMRERERMPRGPDDGGFAHSPFGPPGLLDGIGGGGGPAATAFPSRT